MGVPGTSASSRRALPQEVDNGTELMRIVQLKELEAVHDCRGHCDGAAPRCRELENWSLQGAEWAATEV
jgi:hypothetical protein